jgi:glycosyltransferase involved in cell wall biosynthesis
MRILHVLGKLDHGGVENWLIQVLRNIDRNQYQMDFMVHHPNPGAYDEKARSFGSRVIHCPGYRNPARYALNFRRVLREYGPYDVVHSHVHHHSGIVLAIAKAAGVPARIAHSHTTAPEPSPSAIRKAYLSTMEHLIRENATLGIAISKPAGDSLMPTWQRKSNWYLRPYGIETEPFDVSVDHTIRRELGLPTGCPVVGHVGRFVDVKNHSLIIQIAADLIKSSPNVRFLLVGDGPLRPEIEAQIAEHSLSHHFVLPGIRTDIARIMKGAMDVFLFPSKYEGLGLVLMEAQLAGLCSVVSDVIPSEAEITEGAVTRVPLSASPAEWAVSLNRILRNKQQCSVPAEIRKQHSIVESVRQMTELYDMSVPQNCSNLGSYPN